MLINLQESCPIEFDKIVIHHLAGGGRGGKFGRSNCPCPNCQELERLGPAASHLRKKNVHSCHIPGCGKVYNKVSYLSHCVTMCHTMSQCVTPCHNVSHHVTMCHTMSQCVTTYHLFHLVAQCHLAPCNITSGNEHYVFMSYSWS